MATGRIKWLDKRKGFGCIIPSDGTEHLFILLSDLDCGRCTGDICEGDNVRYDVRDVFGRKKVENIRPVQDIS